ncbi:aminotransferase-like domain-containing protein [Paenibacillus radicis (ex Gao et al. 2016)]|uniref:GntR family transcriptional regulator n=1 Tax=Paenibacillus radicis (ex Gao et al. 2016) TaxID=1737354 RepID=A0A917GRJ3_9BACL|nr:PLP-dependent aminotransferase family protein [Paenibacillus radicis (ex Gao et al. 2016)]GGG54318.1 GntR family transcriptional regulator [Paenibacillus radicis (ex Gao et al. 2016)]
MKKYLAIITDMEQQIADGAFKQGQKLPSVRSAAKTYGCSVSTVIRAYEELERRHAIYSIPQSGYYVVEKAAGKPADADSEIIDFSSASPDLNVFPYLDFQHCLNKAIDTYKYNLFTYGESKGLDKLRLTLASHLANDQIFATADRIVVTSGVQQALEILAKMPFPNGNSVILVEQPSYDIYLHFLETEGLPVSGIARSAEGIDLQELEERFGSGGIKFFYTMSRYHNPLGTSLRVEERKKIAELASKYNVYIVEDDYMADLGQEQTFDPIYAYNESGHVIYLKSFSKIIFPGLRLGAAVMPENMLAVFHTYKSYADTSLLSQAALEVYIKNGMYERHKRKIYSQYTPKIAQLIQSLDRYDERGMIQLARESAGIHTMFKLPRTVNLDILAGRLAARKISVVTSRKFYLSDYLERDKFLRISISRARLEQIDEGVKAIVEETRRADS